MQHILNDGGREAAGYKGKTGDCVTRAIAIITGIPYQQVYDAMASGNAGQRITRRTRKTMAGKRTGRLGIYVKRKWFKDWMKSQGFVWTPTMLVGQGCKVHLQADELPSGKLIVALSRHYCAVIDGVIHDTYDPNAREASGWWNDYAENAAPSGPRCVYGYWSKA